MTIKYGGVGQTWLPYGRTTNSTVAQWVRNPSWAPLPTVIATDQKFVGLLAIFPDSNFAALSATTSTGTYTVNWGDGTVAQTYASGVQANYQYAYSASGLTDTPVTFTASGSTVNRTAHGYVNNQTISFANIATTTGIVTGQIYYVVNVAANTFQVSNTSGGAALTLTGNGTGVILPYKMAIVTVTATSGNLTGVNINLKNPTPGLQLYESGWLDIALASANFSAAGLAISGVSINVNHNMLQRVNIVNLGGVTIMAYMFYGCASLQTVPLFSTGAVNSMAYMFYGCASLQTVPLFSTGAVTNMALMFYGCASLQTVPLFSTGAVTNMSAMFYGCTSLQSVPLFSTSAVTNMYAMFYGCAGLQTVPLFSTGAVTNMSAMFQGCTSLQLVPLFSTSAVTTMAYMFYGCASLQTVPALNTNAVTTGNFASLFTGSPNIATIYAYNFQFSFSIAALKLSQTAIETVFNNLSSATGQTITISNTNWGAPSPVSLACTTTSGSATVTMASTTGLSVGMEISGIGISSSQSVTFTATGSTVNLTSHGISNGTLVGFSSIVTTTGILVNTPYYVVNAAANTFQVSLTNAGAALTLTSNGTGAVIYGTTITAISPAVSITLSIPASASGSITTSSALLHRSYAIIRGWAVA